MKPLNTICNLIDLPKIEDFRGNLTFIESNKHIPFNIKRVYYLYDVPGGAERGGHAHKYLRQFVIAASGSFDIVLDNAFDNITYSLNRSYHGLFIDKMVWREITNFSSGAVCLVLASEFYDEDDYFRNYDNFVAAAKQVHYEK